MRYLILLVMLWAAPTQAAVIETVEWESKPGAPWFYTTGSPEVDCTIPASPSGGCALRFTYSPGTYSTSFSAGRAERQITSNRPRDLYTGHWNRYSSPFSFNPNNQKIDWCGMLQGETPLGFGSNLVTTWNGFGSTVSGITQLIWGAGSTNHYPNGVNFAASEHLNEWYWFEQHCKLNTPGQADGVYELWINGTLIASYTDLQINESGTDPALGWGVFYHTAEWGGGGGTVPSTQYWWVDHTVISTTPIGVPGGPPPSDTTAPVGVSNFAATVSSSSQVNLSWTATTDGGGSGLAGYTIRRCTGAACTPTVALTTKASTATSHQDTGLTASTTYGYSINAFDGAGNQSAYSAPQYATTSDAPILGAITFDAVANSPDNETLNNTSWSHTVGAGDNRFLLVCLQARGTVANTVLATAVTRTGVGLTKIRSDAYTGSGAYYQTELWQQTAPAVGAGTIAVTWAGSPSEYAVGTSTSYLGVHQSDPIDAHTGASGSSATPAVVVTTVTADAWVVDCAIGRDDSGLTVGAGQSARTDRIIGTTEATNDGSGISTVNGKASPGAETMDWTQTSNEWITSAVALKPAAAATAPSITSATADATGADLTFGATTPTTVRVQTNVDSTVYTVGLTPLETTGRLTFAWLPTMTTAAFYARDAAGNENTTTGAFQTVSLVGVVPSDTTSPTLSNGQPSSVLPQGTTGWSMTATVSEAASCRFSTTDQAYAAMATANQMTVVNLVASYNLTGLTNGSSTVYYIACLDQASPVPNETASRLAVTVAVAAAPAADTTAPSTPTDFLCTVLSASQAECSWSPSTDNVALAGYHLYLCGGDACSTFSQVGTIINTTTVVVDLTGSTSYTLKVKAIDTSNNLSAAFSNASTVTTETPVDAVRPSDLAGLTGIPYTRSMALAWTPGTDNLSLPTTVLEQCAGVGCSDWQVVGATTHMTARLMGGLVPSTVYCFRGKHADQSGNVSLNYSATYCATTQTNGLTQPRKPLNYAIPRQPRN